MIANAENGEDYEAHQVKVSMHQPQRPQLRKDEEKNSQGNADGEVDHAGEKETQGGFAQFIISSGWLMSPVYQDGQAANADPHLLTLVFTTEEDSLVTFDAANGAGLFLIFRLCCLCHYTP
jgi:hypothetical protein